MCTVAAASGATLFDFVARDITNKDFALSSLMSKKAILIVNVASECGYTDDNYRELEQLYAKQKSNGLEILAFPCNQFGAQEPGSADEIQEIVCKRFKAAYPLFAKIDVNGSNTHPVFRFLKQVLPGDVAWNFEKFLVDGNGIPVKRYISDISPLAIESDIVELLSNKA